MHFGNHIILSTAVFIVLSGSFGCNRGGQETVPICQNEDAGIDSTFVELQELFFRDTLLTKAFYKIDAASTLNDSLFTGKDLLIDIYPSNLNNDTYYFLGRDFIPEVGLKEHLKYYYQGATLRFIFADNVPNSLYQTGDKKASIVLTEPSSSTIPPDLFCIKYFKDGGTTYFAGQFKTILSYRRKPIPIE